MKKTEIDPLDYWSADDFEEQVSAALIATYESKSNNKKEIRKKDLAFLKHHGAYIPSNSRVVLFNEESEMIEFDPALDGMPDIAYIGLGAKKITDNCDFEGYFSGVAIQQIGSLPPGWARQAGGKLYKQLVVIAENSGGLDGRLGYFTLQKNGIITSCMFHGYDRDGLLVEEEPHVLKQTEQYAAIALTQAADKRHCWAIQAEEAEAKVTMGCMKEEIKSLLYARSLPLSKTGRKRPVLHLVESHKRRMQAGIDIVIPNSMRGIQTVAIGGTAFTIQPPSGLINNVSKKSKKFFNK